MFADVRLVALSRSVLLAGTLFIAFLLLFCIVRSIKGPRVADRILSVNMSGTMIIAAIAFIGLMQEDAAIIDICLLYALISFLAVVVFSRIYRGEYISLRDRRRREMEEMQAKAYEEGLHGDGDD